MNLYDYIKTNDLDSMSQTEKAKMLSYFHYKESGERIFTMAIISELFSKAGFSIPNTSRLRESLIKGNRGKGKVFLLSKTNKGDLEFIPAVLQETEASIGKSWNDTLTVVSDSELIDEKKFCGKLFYLTSLIKQINSSYKNNCYDACAVLMRRLFEILLILSYQKLQIDDEIRSKKDGNYLMLEGIINNAMNNSKLKLTRIKKEFDTFRQVGNFSAHNITYIAGQKDIDDIKLNYRAMLEELYNKAGII